MLGGMHVPCCPWAMADRLVLLLLQLIALGGD